MKRSRSRAKTNRSARDRSSGERYPAIVTRRIVRLVVDGFNLLGREDDDIARFYASRLPGEPLDGVEDVHFHPVVKPSARVSVAWRF